MKLRLVTSMLVIAVTGAACGSDGRTNQASPGGTPTSVTGALTAAAKTRVALDQLLGEHVFLASIATGHALGGRDVAFKAAAGALDANSKAIADAIAGPLKKTTDQAYEFWASHVGFFVDYTTAVSKKDKAKQEKAVKDLLGYAQAFGSLVNAAIPALPADTVEALVKSHILGLKAVVDAQAKKDFTRAGAALHEAHLHMDMIAKPLAGALGLAGNAGSTAADLHSTLTLLLGEHVYAAAMATGAALGGRTTEFEAVANGILATNSKAIADAVASPLKKTPAQALEFWSSHIGFFVDYTNGVAAKDTAKQSKAVADLTGYAEAFGTLINGAIPSLPAMTVRNHVSTHILGLKAVVDAQAAKDFITAYAKLRDAYGHMDVIGAALSDALTA